MNRIGISLCAAVAAVSLAGCAGSRASGMPTSVSPSRAVPAEFGTLPAVGSLTLDAGVSHVRLIVEARDSVDWVFEAKPAGCATADASPGRLAIARRDQHCSVRWDVRAPLIADVRVNVSVGDIDAITPFDR